MADENAKPKRIPRAYFTDKAGERSQNPSGDTVAVVSEFKSHDNISRKVSDFPTEIQGFLAWHGLKQLMGDARASEGKEGEETTHENLLARLERLVAGDWVKQGEAAGPRTSVLAEAVVRVLRAKGEEVDEAREQSIREKLKDKEVRAATLAHPDYAAEFEKMKAERQAAKAKEAAAKAKEAAKEGGETAGPKF